MGGLGWHPTAGTCLGMIDSRGLRLKACAVDRYLENVSGWTGRPRYEDGDEDRYAGSAQWEAGTREGPERGEH